MWRGVTIMFLPPRRRPGWEGPGWRGNGSCRHPHTLDFPFEYDPRMRLHRRAHFLAQRLDIGAGRTAEVEQEVAMFLAHLRVAAAQATEVGRASCRERVCQYVELSGGAVSLKKKNQK